MFVLAVLLQLWQKCLQGSFGVANQPVIQLCAAAELFSANIDLNNGRMLRKKLLIREIGTDHQQGVATHHREITGGKSKQAGHTDIERVIVFDELLSAQ